MEVFGINESDAKYISIFTNEYQKTNPKPTVVISIYDLLKQEMCIVNSYESLLYLDVDITQIMNDLHVEMEKTGLILEYLDEIIEKLIEKNFQRVIITDIKYNNEIEWISKYGGSMIDFELN